MAQKKTKALVPLVDQLFKRATYIMKRLVDIVTTNMDTHLRDGTSLEGLILPQQGAKIEMSKFPFFMQRVKDYYYKYVEKTAESCKKRCMDEFYSTQIIYWDLVKYASSAFHLYLTAL